MKIFKRFLEDILRNLEQFLLKSRHILCKNGPLSAFRVPSGPEAGPGQTGSGIPGIGYPDPPLIVSFTLKKHCRFLLPMLEIV